MNNACAQGALKQAGSNILLFTSRALLCMFLHFLSASSPNPSPNSSSQVVLTEQVSLSRIIVHVIWIGFYCLWCNYRSRGQRLSTLQWYPSSSNVGRSQLQWWNPTRFLLLQPCKKVLCISSFSHTWQCTPERDLLAWNCWSKSTCLYNLWDIVKFSSLCHFLFIRNVRGCSLLHGYANRGRCETFSLLLIWGVRCGSSKYFSFAFLFLWAGLSIF